MCSPSKTNTGRCPRLPTILTSSYPRCQAALSDARQIYTPGQCRSLSRYRDLCLSFRDRPAAATAEIIRRPYLDGACRFRQHRWSWLSEPRGQRQGTRPQCSRATSRFGPQRLRMSGVSRAKCPPPRLPSNRCNLACATSTASLMVARGAIVRPSPTSRETATTGRCGRYAVVDYIESRWARGSMATRSEALRGVWYMESGI